MMVMVTGLRVSCFLYVNQFPRMLSHGSNVLSTTSLMLVRSDLAFGASVKSDPVGTILSLAVRPADTLLMYLPSSHVITSRPF